MLKKTAKKNSMINIQRFVCNMFQENCYVLSDESKEAVIIDSGALFSAEKQSIIEYIESEKLIPTRLLSTHGHIDHNIGNKFIYDKWGLKAEIDRDDEELIKNLPQQATLLLRIKWSKEHEAPIGNFLNTASPIQFGNHHFSIIKTPGHSPGSVVFYSAEEQILFSGDTLFHLSVGRTDLPGGSERFLIDSLHTLSQLPAETKVYPGHGESTTIGFEVSNNLYMT